ncbi:hypothetical protein F2P56_020399 [Juglans regia]|uniref:Uncharacterized protein n=2 Tax=Juglans regia TaxID=51240 RepID=A0A833U2M8_JUGRE|nr:uncharacterized protein At4g10930 isoform X1 [Juglans regia]KAF5460535.1 hypothetical protein F2P56_020399 [Juglans regia]
MEVDLDTRGISEEDTFEVDDDIITNIDNSNFEGEGCGICMDVVIDRGVLDCCQHWFCFACIDNWATITNLCPLCQNEFQLITCVPVYDTIGSNKVDEDSFSRDDDWCIEEKNNMLSFPSYYIDENAVICLDGDGCKIRSGSVTIEGDSNLDTSIACDSCDIWYHAFCVGFDSEATSESTWLCPRCVPQESGVVLTQRPNNERGPEDANCESFVEDAFAGKVSISVADAGETAVVISMVGENQWTGEPNESFLSTVKVEQDLKTETVISSSDAISHKVETPSMEKTIIQPIFEAKELELSLSHDPSFSLTSNSLVISELKTSSAVKAMKEQSSFHGIENTSRKLTSESCIGNRQSEDESTIGLHLGLSVGAFLSVDDIKNDRIGDQVTEDVQQQIPSEKSLAKDANENAAMVGVKRKYIYCSEHESTSVDGNPKPKIVTEVSRKKIKAEGRIEQVPTEENGDASVLDNSKSFPTPMVVPKDERLKHHQDEDDIASDIMSIVQGRNHRLSKEIACPNPPDKSSIERENMAGLRVKKIMRRASEDKESSMAVQKLRREIREAVREKSAKDFGESLFDPKLLAAFRAAVAVPKTEPVKKLAPSAVKSKKSMLQKGKVRENLTKKIYGASNGRRKRAWDRDCEVEFWKHRCMRATKPEKIETLKSVLGLLRKSADNSDQGSESQATNPILSRLYLADTSVFPRKDNLKPLSALKAVGSSEQNKEQPTSADTCSKASLDSSTKCTESNKIVSKARVSSFGITESKNNAPTSKSDVASAPSKVTLSTRPAGSSISAPCDSKGSSTQKQQLVKSDGVKSDKRKWALEVLARKTAVASRNTSNELQEDNAVLRRNYPLLAQLPAEMRPVLAPSHHNKIPLSVRQTQLHRLTEYFLRKANLSVIRRTAETEFAVADAVNIEKEVADRSNSKIVYLNLCSQEMLHHSDNSKSSIATEALTSPSAEVPIKESDQATNQISTDPVILDALRSAGLVSDSPPNSPQSEKEVLNKDDPSIREEGPDDVFDMDSCPELDIYGDFEYELDDEDYIGSSTTKVSKLPPEESASKMKVVFSTLNSEKLNSGTDINDHGKPGNFEAPKDSTLPQKHSDAGISTTMEGETDNSCVPPEPFSSENGEELSIVECEELYGPDKEPLMKKFPEVASRKIYGQVDEVAENKDAVENENNMSNKVVNAENMFVATVGPNSSGGEHSPNQFQTGKNVEIMEKECSTETSKRPDSFNHVFKKVEAYIKEHIRPLCKSGVITTEQYRWAVTRTTDKVMRYHCKAKNANFLIKEGEKVKKLAEQYVEAAQQKEKSDSL